MMKLTLKFIVITLLFCLSIYQSNGQGFKIITYPLENTTAADLCIDNGGAWVATQDGAARLVNHEWVYYNSSNSLNIDSVKQIIKDDAGVVWFLGSTGVAQLNNDVWSYSHSGDFDSGGLLDYTPGSVWFKFRNDELLKISSTNTTVVDPEYSSIDGIEQDPSGQYWAFNVDCIFYLEDNTWKSDTCLFPIRDFHIDKLGNQWVANGDGLIYYRAANASKFEQQVIPFDAPSFSCINSDYSGNIYFGTWSEGVIVKTLIGWTSINTDKGLINNTVHDIEVDEQDNIWVSVSSWAGGLSSSVHVIIKDEGGINRLQGVIFADTNNDGIQNENEPGIPNLIIETNPQGYYSITNSEGKFAFAPMVGANTIGVQLRDFWEQGGTPLTYSFNYPDEAPQFSIGLQWKEVHDVAISLTGNAARPGFNTNYYIYVRNEGSVAENIEVTLQYDPVLAFISSTEEPTTSSNGQMVFSFNNLKAQQGKSIDLMFNLPATVALGTTLISEASVSTQTNETDIIDNIDSVAVIVTGSFDPNDKLVKEGILEERLVELGKPLTYTIRFQNTGTDYAFNVNVFDTLDAHLDLTTLEVLAASHHMTYSLVKRILKFNFADIMLPDSTNNEPASHGYVSFRIKPLTATLNNTVVRNSAAIYFDFNEAVITNKVSNKLVTELPKDDDDDDVLGTEDDWTGKMFYPNPVSGNTLYLKDTAKGFNSAEVISLNGALLQSFTLSPNQEQLELQTLPPGVYLLKFADQQKIIVTKLVIR